VLELAGEGADIVIADVDVENAQRTAAEVREQGRQCSVVEMDITDVASIKRGLDRAISERGHVDILVNNAGVAPSHVGAGATAEDWDRCYEVNLKGMWAVSRAMASHFRSREGGKIVNIASIAGRAGGAGLAPYNASKAGAISLTQSLAADLGRSNINVNAVCPGLLWTDMWRGLEGMMSGDDSPEVVDKRENFERILRERCPLGREQTPADIGKAVAFLASEDARNISGQSLNVDGGIRFN
jgi:NAD(P)-dependent dehydrogenase (short-subunit alcohol dehydrogenase family)